MDDSLWESPGRPAQRPISAAAESTGRSTGNADGPRPSYEDTEARDAALRQELASVRKVNEAIEGVIQNLNRAQTSMKVGSASDATFMQC